MAINLTIKASLISLALGIPASSLGIYHLATLPKTLGESLFQSGGFKLIDKNDADKWKKLSEKYKSIEDTKDGRSPAKIENFSINESDAEQNALINQCENLWNTQLSQVNQNDKNRKMTEIKTWCIESAIALADSQ